MMPINEDPGIKPKIKPVVTEVRFFFAIDYYSTEEQADQRSETLLESLKGLNTVGRPFGRDKDFDKDKLYAVVVP